MVIAEDGYNNFEASTLRTLSSQCNRILQNILEDGSINYEASILRTVFIKYNIILIFNHMLVPYNQLVCMVIAEEVIKDILKCTQTGIIIDYHVTNM
jgi:hypothetical protein